MVENPKALKPQGSFSKAAPHEEGALLFRAKNGDADAFSELLSRYRKMLFSLSNSFCVPDSERDDLSQEGLIGFYKAVLLYDPKIASFSTFSYLCAKRSMLSALKGWNRKQTGTLSLEDTEALEAQDFSLAPLDAVIDRENCELLLHKCSRALSKYESSVLKLTLSGKSTAAVAKALQTSQKSVGNALSRARRKLSVLL